MKVYFLSLRDDTPKRGFWDYGLVEDLLLQFEKIEVSELPIVESAIVVIPARSHADLIDQINTELQKIDHVVLFLMGDEEASFPSHKIKHKSVKIWVQNPSNKQSEHFRKLGCGYPSQIKDCTELPTKKTNDFFFAGQITHIRRELMATKLLQMKNGVFMPTVGFAQGLSHDLYYQQIAQSKVVPCPSGPVTVDTFRVYEALELGAVPIADTDTPKAHWKNYWQWLFDEEVPFPTISNYDDLPGYVEDCAKQYPQLNNKVQTWWFRYKSKLIAQLYSDIELLTGQNLRSDITVVIPVSPIKSHPSTDIIEETISTIRHHLPNAEIIVTFDGVRKEQEKMRDRYDEHIRRFLWKSRKWGIVTPYIFDRHIHQNGMLSEIIDKIHTKLILYVEQDTPLVTDEQIDWQFLQQTILSGESNVIRFHFEAQIPNEHDYLMLGKSNEYLMRTIQWSQRPHLASKAFYRQMLTRNFSDKANCFIEDLVHGKLIQAYKQDGMQGWNQWRVHIYMPDEKNIKRSYNLDGRAGAEKYDDKQVW